MSLVQEKIDNAVLIAEVKAVYDVNPNTDRDAIEGTPHSYTNSIPDSNVGCHTGVI